MPCYATFAGGYRFNLTALSLHGLQQRPCHLKPCRNMQPWEVVDAETNWRYLFNVCGVVDDGQTCPRGAAAVVITRNGRCLSTGQYAGMEWQLIQPGNPSRGVELYYFDGSSCAMGYTRRALQIKFICDPEGSVDSRPDQHTITKQDLDCHIGLQWKTPLACPEQVNVQSLCSSELKQCGGITDLKKLTHCLRKQQLSPRCLSIYTRTELYPCLPDTMARCGNSRTQKEAFNCLETHRPQTHVSCREVPINPNTI